VPFPGLALENSKLYFFEVQPPHLFLEDFAKAGTGDFAAALTRLEGESGQAVSLHSHHFWESFLILEGSGIHRVGGQECLLEAGQLWLIRPSDTHSVHPHPTCGLRFINVAFRTRLWLEFLDLLNRGEQGVNWQASPTPTLVKLSGRDFNGAESLYQEAIQNALSSASRVFLARFWVTLIPWLTHTPEQGSGALPGWLEEMLEALNNPEGLRLGLPAQVLRSRLSAAHVSRSFKTFVGQTPTEYINTRRLHQASVLLSNTDTEIVNIALDCGFENLSYFYRRFQQFFGCTPRNYRLKARRSIAP